MGVQMRFKSVAPASCVVTKFYCIIFGLAVFLGSISSASADLVVPVSTSNLILVSNSVEGVGLTGVPTPVSQSFTNGTATASGATSLGGPTSAAPGAPVLAPHVSVTSTVVGTGQ